MIPRLSLTPDFHVCHSFIIIKNIRILPGGTGPSLQAIGDKRHGQSRNAAWFLFSGEMRHLVFLG